MIRFHPSIALAEVRRAAALIDCRLVSDGHGGIVITPLSAERHGNGHVVRMPHHKAQFKHVSLPTGPEAA